MIHDIPVRPHVLCAMCRRPFARRHVPLPMPPGSPMEGKRVCGDCRSVNGWEWPGHDHTPEMN